MIYNSVKLREGLELAEAPDFLVSLLTLEDGETSVITEAGFEARISIDTFNGVRTATCEITDRSILHRISAKEDHFLYEQIALCDGAVTVLTEQLDYQRVCEPDPRDAINEFLEVVEL